MNLPVDPYAWLVQRGVRVIERATGNRESGSPSAYFTPGADLKRAAGQVFVPEGFQYDSPEGRWRLWHAAAQVADTVIATPRGRQFNPRGAYSWPHAALLQSHRAEIVAWNPSSRLRAVYDPGRLFAETVACAILRRALVPVALLDAFQRDFIALGFPVSARQLAVARAPERSAMLSPEEGALMILRQSRRRLLPH